MFENIRKKLNNLTLIIRHKLLRGLAYVRQVVNLDTDNPSKLRVKQIIYLGFGIVIFIAAIFLFTYAQLPFFSNNHSKVTKSRDKDGHNGANKDGTQVGMRNKQGQSETDNYQLKLATESIKGEKKWQNYLEDKIDEEQKLRDKQLKLLGESFEQREAVRKTDQDSEFEEIKARLAFTLNELERLKTENISIRDELAMIAGKEEEGGLPSELNISMIEDEEDIALPESSYDYIPATSYVTGKLLGGIAVSTAVSASAAPIPVVIRLETRGNLPRDFAVDIKHCRILGSAYGDISSERAVIRAEEMVCEDRQEELVTTTRVAGVIYGDDGMNGIRGSIVSMSEKHFKNAFTSGVVSGFANTASGQSGLNITSLGAINTKRKNGREMAEEGLMSGVSSAAEKLADYHIKLAENISPVILIPGGTRVDVMFTKGVHIGSRNIRDKLDKIRKDRDKNKDKGKS